MLLVCSFDPRGFQSGLIACSLAVQGISPMEAKEMNLAEEANNNSWLVTRLASSLPEHLEKTVKGLQDDNFCLQDDNAGLQDDIVLI